MKFLLLVCFLSLVSANLILAFERQDPELEERRNELGSEEEEEQYEENPYLFDEQRWRTTVDEEGGNIKILERFNSKSELLRGIKRFRVSVLEANPRSFLHSHHWDADCVSFVNGGRGTVSLVYHDNRETFNVKRGDIFRVPSGTIFYLVNTDNHEKLQIIDFIYTFSIPGHFETYFNGGGKENPETFFREFDAEVLAAAFNVEREKVEKLFGERKRGVFLRASEEQIRELTKQASSEGGVWPFGGSDKSSGPFNLFDQRPFASNNYGQLYQALPHEFKQVPELDLDVGVSFANFSRGAMAGPFFNTRAVKVAYVVQGKGRFQMACPHLGRSRSKESGSHYQTVRGELSRGDLYVTLAGHPLVTMASDEEHLEVLCFEVNDEHNQRVPLAGKENIMQQLDKVAKELSFGVTGREVDEIFNSQRESLFYPGPHLHQIGGRASA